jgi:histidyl-tRNA synthetase
MYQAPRGTQDILPEEQPYWRHVQGRIAQVCALYGYAPIETPLFENTEIFARGVGEGTDIVDKEMYSFLDRGGDSLTLRPELTASIVRAYIEHGLAKRPQPVRLYGLGPCFRYERPQAGRYRQHNQLSVEGIGEMDPALDVEVMSVAWHLYADLGFRNLTFQINSIGCPKCRPPYLERLVAYYRPYQEVVCQDCQRRLVKNPMRLLDCKEEQCQPIIAAAPYSTDYLCPECREHFATLQRYLKLLQRPYTFNHRLVRGLDYYTKTVFEVWAEGIGAQNAVCGGGRYDVLAEILGGPPTPAVGFGSGIERIILTIKQQQVAVPPLPVPVALVAYQGPAAKEAALALLARLRAADIPAISPYGERSLKAQLRQAGSLGVRYALIIGEEEVCAGTVTVRDMARSQQQALPLDEVLAAVKQT